MIYKHLKIYASVAFCLIPGIALAGPGKISSPYVKKGEWGVESIGTYGLDYDDAEDNAKATLKLEYGFTDFFKAEIEGEIQKRAGSSSEYTATEIGALFQVTPKGRYFVDAGLKLGYEIAADSDDADVAKAELRLAKKLGHVEARMNTTLSREVGDNSEGHTEADIEAGAYKKYGAWQLGGEYFAVLGEISNQHGFSEQGHYIGPLVGYDFTLPGDQTLSTKLGYVHGISRGAADGVFKYELKLAF